MAGPYSWSLHPAFAADASWLRAPETLAADDARLVKAPRPGAGTRVVRLTHAGENLILKEYRAAGATARLKAMFRVPAALRAMHTGLRLTHLGLPVIEVLGAGYRKGSSWHSFLLTRELTAVVPFRRYLRRSGPNPGFAVAAIARLLGQLHAANFLHRDAHLSNFVIQTNTPRPNVILVDVDGVRPSRGVTLPLAARDLGRMLDPELSLRRMMRFAVAYSRARSGAISPRALLQEMRAHYETDVRRPCRSR